MKQKYHVALSFAGEDREYVKRVATQLTGEGVEVFYGEFEEAALWGKDLYTHLRDVYENRALFTVIFVSEHYKRKVWPNHELASAQARALESNREYILPAFFNESVEVPGLLKTIKHISLVQREPEDFARLIVKKLEKSGVELASNFAYSEEAKADVDFPRPAEAKLGSILNNLKSHTWPTQGPAVKAIFKLDWKSLNKNEIFVLGRNIYQCACGSEWNALSVMNELRERLAEIPEEAAPHLLNGMFFEVYFDKEGQFRGENPKSDCLGQLLKLQRVKKFEPSILFIRNALRPYEPHLLFLPSTAPEAVVLELAVKLSDPPEVKSLKHKGREFLARLDDETYSPPRNWKLWKLAIQKFTIGQLKEMLAESWSIPLDQLEVRPSKKMKPNTEYRLPKGSSLTWPK